MVTSLSNRLGAVGLSLIAGALIFGALAGSIVVHRLQMAPTSSVQPQDQQGDQGLAKNHGQSKPKHASHGRGHQSPKPPENSQEGD